MAYLRFVLLQRDHDATVASGPFRLAYRLCREGQLDEPTRARAASLLLWFERHLPVPDRFCRSRAGGAWRRQHHGISWFKDSAHTAIDKMRQLMRLLDAHGHASCEIVETRVGYLLYEDEQQVVAEPFRDTRTGQV